MLDIERTVLHTVDMSTTTSAAVQSSPILPLSDQLRAFNRLAARSRTTLLRAQRQQLAARFAEQRRMNVEQWSKQRTWKLTAEAQMTRALTFDQRDPLKRIVYRTTFYVCATHRPSFTEARMGRLVFEDRSSQPCCICEALRETEQRAQQR